MANIERHDQGMVTIDTGRQIKPPTLIESMRKIVGAAQLIDKFGGTDGAHHKQWVLDQVMRALLGSNYVLWVADRTRDNLPWDEGTPP